MTYLRYLSLRRTSEVACFSRTTEKAKTNDGEKETKCGVLFLSFSFFFFLSLSFSFCRRRAKEARKEGLWIERIGIGNVRDR